MVAVTARTGVHHRPLATYNGTDVWLSHTLKTHRHQTVCWRMCCSGRPERSLDLGRTGEDLDKDPHVEVNVAGEERDNVALVAVGVGLQAGQDDSHTLRGGH